MSSVNRPLRGVPHPSSYDFEESDKNTLEDLVFSGAITLREHSLLTQLLKDIINQDEFDERLDVSSAPDADGKMCEHCARELRSQVLRSYVSESGQRLLKDRADNLRSELSAPDADFNLDYQVSGGRYGNLTYADNTLARDWVKTQEAKVKRVKLLGRILPPLVYFVTWIILMFVWQWATGSDWSFAVPTVVVLFVIVWTIAMLVARVIKWHCKDAETELTRVLIGGTRGHSYGVVVLGGEYVRNYSEELGADVVVCDYGVRHTPPGAVYRHRLFMEFLVATNKSLLDPEFSASVVSLLERLHDMAVSSEESESMDAERRSIIRQITEINRTVASRQAVSKEDETKVIGDR